MNTKTKAGFMERPFISAGVLLVALFALRFVINFILTLVFPKSMDDNTISIIMYWTVTIVFLAIWIFYRRVRKDYIPTIGLKRGPKTTILVCLPFIVYMLIVLFPAVASGEVSLKQNALMVTLSLSVSAGIVEEIMCRDIPIGNAMRNITSRKQLIKLVLLTSVLFGALHMYNLLAGATVIESLGQSIHAAGFGCVFAAVYLRTGSVVPGMIVHFLHDFVTGLGSGADVNTAVAAEANKAATIGAMSGLALVGILIAMFLLRKSKWEEIKENFGIDE